MENSNASYQAQTNPSEPIPRERIISAVGAINHPPGNVTLTNIHHHHIHHYLPESMHDNANGNGNVSPLTLRNVSGHNNGHRPRFMLPSAATGTAPRAANTTANLDELDLYEDSQQNVNLSENYSNGNGKEHESVSDRENGNADDERSTHENNSNTNNSDNINVTNTKNGNKILNDVEAKWKKLQNLKLLYDGGFIDQSEYEERRRQIVDAMTGTSHSKNQKYEESNSGPSAGVGSIKLKSNANGLQQVKKRKPLGLSIMPHRPPESFEAFEPERAVRHVFDLKTRTWTQHRIWVRVDEVPFAKGGLRLVYHMQEAEPAARKDLVRKFAATSGVNDNNDAVVESDDEDEKEEVVEAEDKFVTKFNRYNTEGSGINLNVNPDFLANGRMSLDTMKTQETATTRTRRNLVAKVSVDRHEDPSSYFRDVEMQAHCSYFAKLFNSYDPPRKIRFCKAWVVELLDREDQPLCGVERYIETAELDKMDMTSSTKANISRSRTNGTTAAASYMKHNNNYGFVSEDHRNTPQAFSHFTYEASCRTMIVVDIQGVGDMYTDPQVHTLSGRDFGKGNLGRKGMRRFLETHRCNSICKYLKLHPVNPKAADPPHATKPAFPLMQQKRVYGEQFIEKHYFERVPYVRKILKSRSRNRLGDSSDEDLTSLDAPLVPKASRYAEDEYCGSWCRGLCQIS